MSRWDETYEERRVREREEERRYRGDVIYDVWRYGGNVDRINDDRVHENYHSGVYAEDAARVEMRSQRERRQLEEPEYPEYPDE